MIQIIVNGKRQKGNEGEVYINAFPKLKKWINECLCCHEKGYNPSMPEKITTVDGSLEVYFIKKYFKPLTLNKNGLCPQCEKILKKNSNYFHKKSKVSLL